jgi:hypothetical protein
MFLSRCESCPAVAWVQIQTLPTHDLPVYLKLPITQIKEKENNWETKKEANTENSNKNKKHFSF